jgi:outer membrane lipoprotein SlyB
MSRLVDSILAIAIATSLVGCVAPGKNLASNAYRADQVNTRQTATVVNVLAVMPAKVEVSNAQNKQTAKVVGTLLGAVSGAVLGHNLGDMSSSNVAIGAVGGGMAGSAAGSLVADHVLVDGVSITYEDHGQTYNSVQVGKLCEFEVGKPAVVIATSARETRIQANATCPAPSK